MFGRIFFGILLLPMTLGLTGCASVFFPDFNDGNEVVVDDGGKVEIHKVEEKGILVGDKANASYEEEEGTEDDETASSEEEVNDDVTRRLSQLSQSDDEQVTPAKVTDITKSDDLPKTKHSDSASENTDDDSAVSSPSMRYLAGIIYFTNGGSYLDGNARTTLRQIANQAKKRHAQVEVYGFASSRTRNTDPVSHKLANFKISAERADNVASALRSLGVEKDQIAVQALSDSMPMYQEVMPEGERLNRRAEIYLTY